MKKPPTFILLGAAGYVAPRHMAAIKAVGGKLITAVDPCDSVGVLDQYFPKCKFYNETPGSIYNTGGADYLVVCSPNYLHYEQIEEGLGFGMNVIVEKPAVLTCDNLDKLHQKATAREQNVNCVLNMRLHHDAQLLKAMVDQTSERFTVDVTYHTPRGPWYWQSWKANKQKSGGILFNIGVHLIDLALWVFGKEIKPTTPFIIRDDSAIGMLNLERADVYINLSINGKARQRTFRVGYAEFDFTNGFEDLHTESYRQILAGNGFTLEDARPAIELCERLTNAS